MDERQAKDILAVFDHDLEQMASWLVIEQD